MDKVWPWVRSIVGLVLGVLAIQLVNRAGMALFPDAFSTLDSDPDRVVVLVVTMLAGIVGSFVVGAVARHRLWLHMLAFLLVMLAIDVAALTGPLAAQPTWFKGLVAVTLLLQVAVGGWLAGKTWRRS